MIRAFIVDDHAVVRAGLRYTLTLDGDIQIAGECANGTDAASAIAAAKPDVTLLDIRLPGKDGLTVLEELLRRNPKEKVVMLTTSEADNDVFRAVNLGAKGYLMKDRNADDIVKAVRLVAGGSKYITDQAKELYRRRQMVPTPSPREQEVLEYIVDGLSNDAIAAKMGISREGVKMHVKHLLEKFVVPDRTNLAVEALQRGFVHR